MVKISLIFVTLLSGIVAFSAQAQAPYYSVRCLYEWTLDCERTAMEEERAYREQMLEQMREQNRLLQEQNEQQERLGDGRIRWRNLN